MQRLSKLSELLGHLTVNILSLGSVITYCWQIWAVWKLFFPNTFNFSYTLFWSRRWFLWKLNMLKGNANALVIIFSMKILLCCLSWISCNVFWSQCYIIRVRVQQFSKLDFFWSILVAYISVREIYTSFLVQSAKFILWCKALGIDLSIYSFLNFVALIIFSLSKLLFSCDWKFYLCKFISFQLHLQWNCCLWGSNSCMINTALFQLVGVSHFLVRVEHCYNWCGTYICFPFMGDNLFIFLIGLKSDEWTIFIKFHIQSPIGLEWRMSSLSLIVRFYKWNIVSMNIVFPAYLIWFKIFIYWNFYISFMSFH